MALNTSFSAAFPTPFQTAFAVWKQELLEHSSHCGSQPIRQLGDYVLELFWSEGCDPTLAAFLHYAQKGLCDSILIT